MTATTQHNKSPADGGARGREPDHTTGPPPGPPGTPAFEAWRNAMIDRIVAEAKPLDERQLNRLVSQFAASRSGRKTVA